VQAKVLKFQQLIKGVRGKAWRSVRDCVSLAYEVGLHLIDRISTPENIANVRKNIKDKEKGDGGGSCGNLTYSSLPFADFQPL